MTKSKGLSGLGVCEEGEEAREGGEKICSECSENRIKSQDERLSERENAFHTQGTEPQCEGAKKLGGASTSTTYLILC